LHTRRRKAPYWIDVDGDLAPAIDVVDELAVASAEICDGVVAIDVALKVRAQHFPDAFLPAGRRRNRC
jgi:hypothetical protein